MSTVAAASAGRTESRENMGPCVVGGRVNLTVDIKRVKSGIRATAGYGIGVILVA